MLLALVAIRSLVMMQRVLVDVSACVGEGGEVSEWVIELVSHTYSHLLVVISGNTEGLRYNFHRTSKLSGTINIITFWRINWSNFTRILGIQ